jgi:CRISPR/Cas system-associated endonuclease Cas1
MERGGECFAVTTGAALCDSRRRALQIRARQFAVVLSPRKRLDIARKIVSAKLRTLELNSIDNLAGQKPASAFRKEIAAARSIEDLLVAEARAGAAYFMRFRGTEMRFKDDKSLVFAARAASFLKGKGGTSKARHAATPWGALLNYAYTAALGQCTRAIVGARLDPCFGFLHSPKPGRLIARL